MQKTMKFAYIIAVKIVFMVAKSESLCTQHSTCEQCILSAGCSWCYQEAYEKPRCNNEQHHSDAGCLQISNPTSNYQILENLPLDKNREPHIQIKPQRVKVSLRVGESVKIPLVFTPANNPVDLYYLMDLSSSMKELKQQLAKVGKEIAKEMSEVTKNFRIGFGSFVDKRIFPFSRTTPDTETNACSAEHPCERTYSYKHTLSLSSNASLFESMVEKAETSTNLDAPEGGLDALLQATVCTDIIGWREESRKLLVYSSDAEFHIAGDGKLAGIVEPNDGECHVENGVYTHSLILDYPSVSQINYKAGLHSINIIFAIPKQHVLNLYGLLAKNIVGASSGKLETYSIVKFIKEQYDKIRSKVQMKHDNAESFISVKFETSCNRKDGSLIETDSCDDVHEADNLQFNAIITAIKPPSKKKTIKPIYIYPVGLKQTQKLRVDVEVVSSCDCSKIQHKKSPLCRQNGDLVCGICKCYPGYIGNYCECESSAKQSVVSLLQACYSPNSTEVCSGHGRCTCGQCFCYNEQEIFTGKYCECDSRKCKFFNAQRCGGPERGYCDCENCKCNKDYTGERCECPVGIESCIEPGKTSVCSEHGRCECGNCECDTVKDGQYGGKYCEEKPITGGKGYIYRDCVLCVIHNEGPLVNSSCEGCSTNITAVPFVEAVEGERIYIGVDKEGCEFKFVYDKNEVLRAEDKKICPEEVNMLVVAIGVGSAVILLGLLSVIIWKVATFVYDRREYAKFKKEADLHKPTSTDNPLYGSPMTKFKNPTFHEA